MDRLETFEGLEFHFKAKGGARFFGAAFLGVWLSGWCVGEVFAGSVWFALIWQDLTGERLLSWGRMPEAPQSYYILAFLTVWLAFWTFGGIMAFQALARMLWGRERLVLKTDSLLVERTAFPFAKRREVPFSGIRGFGRRKNALQALQTAGQVEICSFGNQAELDELETLLRKKLSLQPTPASLSAAADLLPPDWSSESLPDGSWLVYKSESVRRKQATALWVLGFVLAGVSSLLLVKAWSNLSLGPLTAILVAATGFTLWGAIWTSRGRHEWLVAKGRLCLRSRFGSLVRDKFEARSLRVSSGLGEDNDLYSLDAFREATPPDQRNTGKYRSLCSNTGDPETPRQLGAWIAKRSGLLFVDDSGRQTGQVDLAALKEKLAASGRLGSLLSKLIKTQPKP